MIVNAGGVTLKEEARKGVLQARDSLQKRAARGSVDPCSLNLLGLLYEHEGLLAEAQKVFVRCGNVEE